MSDDRKTRIANTRNALSVITEMVTAQDTEEEHRRPLEAAYAVMDEGGGLAGASKLMSGLTDLCLVILEQYEEDSGKPRVELLQRIAIGLAEEDAT